MRPRKGTPAYKRWLAKARERYELEILRYTMRHTAKRLDATRRLVSFRYLRGDLHSHSVFSDGRQSVADMKASADAAGLDFAFITDHRGIAQKRECAKFSNLWWGQEPGAGMHHLVLLARQRKYVPTYARPKDGRKPTAADLQKDFDTLRAEGIFFFIPHPAGWFPSTWYSNRQIGDGRETLAQMRGRFAMEVLSGIGRATPVFDEWCEAYVKLWDELLSNGQEVTGLGCTDAHGAAWFGNTWTGVVGARCSLKSVLTALKKGHCFASQGPAASLRAGANLMGDVLHTRKGRKVTVKYECADARGLAWVRVVAGGKVVAQKHEYGKPVIKGSHTVALTGEHQYVRVECAAIDDRRALTTPIYIQNA